MKETIVTPNYLDIFKYVNEINTRSTRLTSYIYSYFVLVSDFYDYDKINEASLLCLVTPSANQGRIYTILYLMYH